MLNFVKQDSKKIFLSFLKSCEYVRERDIIMTEVSFGSTYRIPLVEQNITRAKRTSLKNLADNYSNVLYPKGNNGYVRVSMKAEDDVLFERQLKQLGFKVFQKFAKHELPVEEMDDYIKEALTDRDYQQFGKQMKAKSNHKK